MTFLLRLIFLFVVGVTARAANAGETCRSVNHLGQVYSVCSFDPQVSQLHLYQSDHAGRPYLTFDALVKDVQVDRTRVLFAVNGGMYRDDFSAVGLYIENGIQRQAISTKPGWGNFHLQPNGVFLMQAGKAAVMETQAYLASGITPWFATQSGPMLVIGGKIHPAFLPASDSFKIRNGVGVGKDGRVSFAVSDGPVRFHDFATLFRDALGCDDALFLDGTISSLYVPDTGRNDAIYPLGPIIAVIETRPG